MKVVYHPAVQLDVSRILRHYDGINDQLGDEFWDELNTFFNQAAANPQPHSVITSRVKTVVGST